MSEQPPIYPPIFAPSGELGGLIFALLPCLREEFRPLASFAFHMTELTKMKTIPAVPPIRELTNLNTLFSDKSSLLSSLSFYGKAFHMPFLTTLATLLQGYQFYQEYKDLLPALFQGMGGGTDGSLNPDSILSLFSLFGGQSKPSKAEEKDADSCEKEPSPETETSQEAPCPTEKAEEAPEEASSFQDGLLSMLTPEQRAIYEQLMHTS